MLKRNCQIQGGFPYWQGSCSAVMRTSRLCWGKGQSWRCLHLLIHWGDIEGRCYRAVQVRVTTLKVKLKAEDGALSQEIAASRKNDTCFLSLILWKEKMKQWLNQPEHPKGCPQHKVSHEQMMSGFSLTTACYHKHPKAMQINEWIFPPILRKYLYLFPVFLQGGISSITILSDTFEGLSMCLN